jgi:hypothetical protein
MISGTDAIIRMTLPFPPCDDVVSRNPSGKGSGSLTSNGWHSVNSKCSQLAVANGFCGRVRMYSCRCCMNKVCTWKGGGPHFRLITDEINLFADTDAWTTLHNHEGPPKDHGRRPSSGSSFARGDILRVTGAVVEPTSFHGSGMNVAYLLPCEQLRFVHEVGNNAVALGFPPVVKDVKRGNY